MYLCLIQKQWDFGLREILQELKAEISEWKMLVSCGTISTFVKPRSMNNWVHQTGCVQKKKRNARHVFITAVGNHLFHSILSELNKYEHMCSGSSSGVCLIWFPRMFSRFQICDESRLKLPSQLIFQFAPEHRASGTGVLGERRRRHHLCSSCSFSAERRSSIMQQLLHAATYSTRLRVEAGHTAGGGRSRCRRHHVELVSRSPIISSQHDFTHAAESRWVTEAVSAAISRKHQKDGMCFLFSWNSVRSLCSTLCHSTRCCFWSCLDSMIDPGPPWTFWMVLLSGCQEALPGVVNLV